MGLGASMSILGLYRWDDTLFDSMWVPDDFEDEDKQLLINNLLMDCAELEVLYPDWNMMRFAIENWSKKEAPTWNAIYAAMMIEYNPIENYNRVEKINVQNRGALTHGGTDSVAGSGFDSDVSSGSDTLTNKVTSYENNTLVTHDQVEDGKGTTITHNKGATDTTTYGHTITDTTGSLTQSQISGNIGVTTTQQMLEQEIAVRPKLNLMDWIIDSFKNRFCLLVY